MRYLALASPGFRDNHFSTGVNAATLAHAPMPVYNAKNRMQAAFIDSVTATCIEPPAHFLPSTRGGMSPEEDWVGA